jgi:hypothetical protein
MVGRVLGELHLKSVSNILVSIMQMRKLRPVCPYSLELGWQSHF